jgi:hypothetical protein
MGPPRGGSRCPVLQVASDIEAWVYEHFEKKRSNGRALQVSILRATFYVALA